MMNTHKKAFWFVGIVLLTILVPSAVFAQLVPCEGAGCGSCEFLDMINRIVKWFISVMSILCGLVVVYAGIQMVVSGGNESAWSHAKTMLTNVLIGFMLLLTSWLIVDTIMKTFVGKDTAVKLGRPWHSIQCVSQTTPSGGPQPGTGGIGVITPPSGCATQCVSVPTGITVKSGACSGGGVCTVSSEIAGNISTLDGKLDAAGINWQITEAFPPTRQHKNPCHAAGTCVDANCIGGCSAASVKTFIESANASGMQAVYEVKTQAEKDTLVGAGVPAQSVEVLGSWISAAHFSVYKGGG